MDGAPTSTDRFRSYLVLVATVGMIAFNWTTARGELNEIGRSALAGKYQTVLTPADYALSFWWIIYFGLLVFSIYQLLPANVARFCRLRSLYILSCLLNVVCLYLWRTEAIVLSFVVLVVLTAVLFLITYHLRNSASAADVWFTKAPFGLYFGWTTCLALLNLGLVVGYRWPSLPHATWMALGVVAVFILAASAVLVRATLANFFYPVAVAWALTGIAVGQGGNTAIVVACAFGVTISLITALSFIIDLPTRSYSPDQNLER